MLHNDVVLLDIKSVWYKQSQLHSEEPVVNTSTKQKNTYPHSVLSGQLLKALEQKMKNLAL
jgi:hypothetical protein